MFVLQNSFASRPRLLQVFIRSIAGLVYTHSGIIDKIIRPHNQSDYLPAAGKDAHYNLFLDVRDAGDEGDIRFRNCVEINRFFLVVPEVGRAWNGVGDRMFHVVCYNVPASWLLPWHWSEGLQ